MVIAFLDQEIFTFVRARGVWRLYDTERDIATVSNLSDGHGWGH